ncbi:hypothetical protein CRUP_034662, partial [Coryphaenoides rupestris]
VESVSCFNLDCFESLLLPDNNRALDTGVLLALKELFVRPDAKTTSLHMLSVDCQRAAVLHKVISLAHALKEHAHNLYSFSAVMKALEMPQGPIAVPHLVPLLMAMEGDDPVENSERGCQLLYDVLQAARNAALHAPDYQQHAHALLT